MCGRGCQFPRCWVSVSDGLPVGLVAVVSTLDTLPACEPVPWSLCGWSACSRWDVLPVACGLVAVVSVGVGCAACAVVSTLDTLPAVRVWDVLPVDWWPLDVLPVDWWPLDVLPVAVDWLPWSLLDSVPWSVHSTLCQR